MPLRVGDVIYFEISSTEPEPIRQIGVIVQVEPDRVFVRTPDSKQTIEVPISKVRRYDEGWGSE